MNVPENKTTTLAPAEVTSQTSRTLLNLREMLLRGDFQAGERISELPLVARLGVSRTPIRLALDRLANEGLLEVLPAGGFVVRAFTLADIWDAIEMRGVLEGTAARLAAERLSSDRELDTLRRLRDELDAMLVPTIDSFAPYLDLNEAFHMELLDLARSPMLLRMMERVLSLPFSSPSALVFASAKLPKSDDLLSVAHEQHRAIVEAVENRQGSRAEFLAREHALMSRRNLEAAFQDDSLRSKVPGASLIKLPSAV